MRRCSKHRRHYLKFPTTSQTLLTCFLTPSPQIVEVHVAAKDYKVVMEVIESLYEEKQVRKRIDAKWVPVLTTPREYE